MTRFDALLFCLSCWWYIIIVCIDSALVYNAQSQGHSNLTLTCCRLVWNEIDNDEISDKVTNKVIRLCERYIVKSQRLQLDQCDSLFDLDTRQLAGNGDGQMIDLDQDTDVDYIDHVREGEGAEEDDEFQKDSQLEVIDQMLLVRRRKLSKGFDEKRQLQQPEGFDKAAELSLSNNGHVKDTNIRFIDVRMRNVAISSGEATYWCQTIHLPTLVQKHHIIAYESIIAQTDVGSIHHMLMFSCPNYVATSSSFSYNGPCMSEAMKPSEIADCRELMAGWAVGAEKVVFPKEARMPIGGSSLPFTVVLEIHYENGSIGQNDRQGSGFRLTVTPILRPNDIGMVELGLVYSPRSAIPPNARNFYLTSYCPLQCTEATLPSDGILVFASQLHMHSRGRRIVTRHLTQNNNIQLAYLDGSNNFSHHFQPIRQLEDPVRVMPILTMHIPLCEPEESSNKINQMRRSQLNEPVEWLVKDLYQVIFDPTSAAYVRLLDKTYPFDLGDSLVTTCTYDNLVGRRNRKAPGVVFAGFTSREEMCLNYLFYYPKSRLGYCKSQVAEPEMTEFLSRLTTTTRSTGLDPALDEIKGLFKSINWTPTRIAQLQSFYSKSTVELQCNSTLGQRFPNVPIHIDSIAIPREMAFRS